MTEEHTHSRPSSGHAGPDIPAYFVHGEGDDRHRHVRLFPGDKSLNADTYLRMHIDDCWMGQSPHCETERRLRAEAGR
jgi:hypothetical protein